MAKTYDDMSDKAKDLVLHADNDRHLHDTSKLPILKNLGRKMARKEYDPDKATKLWGYHADRAAMSCCKTHGERNDVWHKMFPTSVRKEAAQHWEKMHRDEVEDYHKGKAVHEGENTTEEVIRESAFDRLAKKIASKEGYSAKEARGAAYAIGKAKYGKKEMARKAAEGRKDESVDPMRPAIFSMLNAAINEKPVDFKEAFQNAIQPSILASLEAMKDDLRQFVFKFTNGEDVTNEPVKEDFVNEASRVLLANYAKKKKTPIHNFDFSLNQ